MKQEFLGMKAEKAGISFSFNNDFVILNNK